jgi:hypothetical protein
LMWIEGRKELVIWLKWITWMLINFD